MIGRNLFKAMVALGISVGLMILVKSTLAYVVPIMFVLAFFGAVFLLIKPTK